MKSCTVTPIGLYEKALPADWCWEQRLVSAAAAGYDFIDMSVDESDLRLARLDWPASERANLRQAIVNTATPILTLCLSGHRKYPMGSRSAELRRQGLDIMRKAIDFAADIGIRIIQVMGYDVFYEPSDDETRARFVEGLQQGVQWASRAGVMLGLENVDTPYLESIERGLALVHQLNSPWFQLYSDMANLAGAGYYPPDQLRLAAGHLIAVHVKDARPGVIRGVPFGQGIVPFRETFQALDDIGFSGPLVVEMWADMDPTGGPLKTAAAARNFVAHLTSTIWSSTPQPVG
jgi:L-ribulose-5-phosphate 3-epimerase